jgi:hypothetical protein
LIAIVKKELQLNGLLYTLLQILSVLVFEKTQLFALYSQMNNTLTHRQAVTHGIYSQFNRTIVTISGSFKSIVEERVSIK